MSNVLPVTSINSAARSLNESVRWGHDFALTPKHTDESPHLGLSAAAFNVLNHENGGAVDTVETSSTFGEITSANPPRRVQLGMRFEF